MRHIISNKQNMAIMLTLKNHDRGEEVCGPSFPAVATREQWGVLTNLF